jgi:hypothetical protein
MTTIIPNDDYKKIFYFFNIFQSYIISSNLLSNCVNSVKEGHYLNPN